MRADSHYMSRFHSVARYRSVKFFSCVIKRRCSHWQERLHHISVPFRRCCWARMFDVTEWVRPCLYLPDSDNVNSLTSPPLHCCLFMSSEVEEKLMELVRECEELYDMSNKKYSECLERNLWGQIGEGMKKSGNFQCFSLLRILKLISFYHHRSSNN